MQPIVTVRTAEALAALADLSHVFRVNASHMEVGAIVALLEEVRALDAAACPDFRLYIDLQGSKMRLSARQPVLEPAAGATLRLCPEDGEGDLLVPPHVFARLRGGLAPGATLSIEDGRVVLAVTGVDARAITATVTRAGPIRPRKGVNAAPHPPMAEPLTARDRAVVAETRRFPFVAYALSFVSCAAEVRCLAEAARGHAVAAKVELPLADETLAEVCAAADELWLCRGDLGAQLGLRAMARYYTRFCAFVRAHVPASRFVLAGEVLEHMVHAPLPTRSEVCHLADAAATGFAACVLSNETADGEFPREAVAAVRDAV